MATVTLASLEALRSELANSHYYLNIRSGYMAPVTLHCSYGDSGETVTFYIFDGGDAVSLDGATASVHGTRRDGANFGPFSCTCSGNKVSFQLQSSMTAVEGGGIAEITISKNGSTIGTANFGILVENATFPNGVSYDTDPSVYMDILKYVQGLTADLSIDYNTKVGQIRQLVEAQNTELDNMSTRIDNIVGSATTSSEIVDIRQGYDGYTYSSAGLAVRQQTSTLNDRIDAIYNAGIESDAFFSLPTDGGTYTLTEPRKGIHLVTYTRNSSSSYAFFGKTVMAGSDFLPLYSANNNVDTKYRLAIKNVGTSPVIGMTVKLVMHASSSSTGDWNPANYPVNIVWNDALTIYPGETKDILLDLMYYGGIAAKMYGGTGIFSRNIKVLVGEYRATNIGKEISLELSLYKQEGELRSVYSSIFSEQAKNAGCFIPRNSISYISPALVPQGTAEGPAKVFASDGTEYTISINNINGSVYSGQKFVSLSFDVTDYLSNNVTFAFDATQSASNPNFYINNIYLSKSPYSWTSQNLVQNLNSYAQNALSYTTKIDFSKLSIDQTTITGRVYLILSLFTTSTGASLGSQLMTVKPYVIYNDARVISTAGTSDGEATTTDLLFWGDSLTAGAGGGGTTYPSVCASELGCSHLNCGVGGETANTIAARQGGNSIILAAGAVNKTLALNDLTDIFGYHVNPLRQGNGSSSGSYIIVNGQTCTLTITQSSATATDATYTISGYTGSNLTVPTVARFQGCTYTGKVTVIWVGQNGSSFTGLSDQLEARMAIIDSMIAHVQNKRYVILGLSTGSTSSRTAEDNTMLKKYGANFFPTRQLLVENGLAITGTTATTQDNTDISNGTVPTSLRSDSVHLNAKGYTAVGKMLAQKIRSLGFDAYL